MPGVRQVLTGLPPTNGATAFMPTRAMTPSVFDISSAQGTPEEITGQPGTQGIPAPYPYAKQSELSRVGTTTSFYAPPRWYPSLYYRGQHLWRGIGGMACYSDNLLPTPAVDPRGLPSRASDIGPQAFAAYKGLTPTMPARPNKWAGGLGRFQTAWPLRMPAWPPSSAR
jgi:hypothetical protein